LKESDEEEDEDFDQEIKNSPNQINHCPFHPNKKAKY
jgi:hypothetical protein